MKGRWTKKEFDFNNVPKVHNLVNRVADIIVKDIKEGITKHSQDIHGKPFKPLSPNTVLKKGHSKPLLDEGKMKNVYVRKRASKGKHIAEIGLNERDRGEVSRIHNEGTKPYTIVPKSAQNLVFETTGGVVFTKLVKHTGVPKREWWGVSKRVEKTAQKMVNEWMKTLYSLRK
jgi:hypothetical protein